MLRLLPSAATSSVILALLLALLGLGAAGFGRLARSERSAEGGRIDPASIAGVPSLLALPAPAGSASSVTLVERTPLKPRASTGRQAESAREPSEMLVADPAEARTEREAIAAFQALERAAPGTLVAQAAQRLDGAGPRIQKVAFLRALLRTDPETSLRWFEHAARAPDDADAHGESLAAFALEFLGCQAPRVEGARQALGRLVLAEGALAPELLRRAAADYARNATGEELTLLRPTLARTQDQLLVAGVVAALEERQDSAAARLAAEFAPQLQP